MSSCIYDKQIELAKERLERKLRLADRLSKKAIKSGEAWDVSNARDAELELQEYLQSSKTKSDYVFEFIDTDSEDSEDREDTAK